MGSEKKRKRRESDLTESDPVADGDALAKKEKKRKRRESDLTESDPAADSDAIAKAERKRARKAAKAAAAAAAATAAATSEETETRSAAAESGLKIPEVTDDSMPPALVSPIASPMAEKQLIDRLYGLVSLAAKAKSLRRGIKEVVLALRKGDKGVCVLAGDVFPVDVIAHLPLVCEEAGVPYCYVPRKAELGLAALTKRPTSVILVSEKASDKSLLKELSSCRSEVSKIQTVY